MLHEGLRHFYFPILQRIHRLFLRLGGGFHVFLLRIHRIRYALQNLSRVGILRIAAQRGSQRKR